LAVAFGGASLPANALSLISTGTSESFHATRICSLLLFIFCFVSVPQARKIDFFKKNKYNFVINLKFLALTILTNTYRNFTQFEKNTNI
jgi:hypothetical protein